MHNNNNVGHMAKGSEIHKFQANYTRCSPFFTCDACGNPFGTIAVGNYG